ncbi:MAG TPA: hypothetical protein VN764_19485, partial [Polyangiaceae bacterium]|nr:hypothetical protein [Polyangiaceae bacterium]
LSDSMGETIHRMVSEIPANPSDKRDDVPSGLDGVVARALLKEPEARFESAMEFARELRRFQQADDEEVIQQLRQMVRQDFDHIPDVVDVEPLRSREEALTRALPSGYRAWSADSLSGEEHFEALAGTQRMGPTLADAPIARLKQERAEMRQQRSLQRILLGLLVVGGFIALGLGAAVALLSRSGSPEQVVVVGGDNSPAASGDGHLPGAAPDVSAAPAVQDVAVPNTSGAAVSARPSGKLATAAPSAAQPANQVPQVDAERQAQLSRAVQSQSAQIQACFTSELQAGMTVQGATLHFTVAESGGQAQVSVQPPALAQTKLGFCLQKAAAQVTFPRLGDTVTFSVPVKARVSRLP